MSDDPPSTRAIVSDRQTRPVDPDALVALAEETLRGEGVAAGELSISLVTEAEMTELHERYMGEPGPTDVLSFPLGEEGLLGDVILCPEVAERQNPDAAAELRLLLVHGVLHLLGYDHHEEQGRAAMWARQERYSGVRVPLDAPEGREAAG